MKVGTSLLTCPGHAGKLINLPPHKTHHRLSPRSRQEFAMAHLSPHDRAVRSGVVLLIVMAMLALFAVVGLSFVFYAESEREGARFNRQGANFDLADTLP